MASRIDLGQGIKIGKFIRREHFDLIHSHTPRASLVGVIAQKIAGVPLIHHLHSPAKQETHTATRNRTNSKVESWAIRKAQRIIAVSKTLKAKVIEAGIPQDRVSVVWNGVPSPANLPERNKPRGEWIVGSMALFRPRKGLEVLLQAIKILRDQGKQVRLRAVGEFETVEYERQILALQRELKLGEVIDWVGFARDVEQEFWHMDLFVLPSLYGEGLPMVLLEAMANGVPVIGTRVEGIPEAIPSKEFGITVNPGQANEIAQAIASLMGNVTHWETMRGQAFQRQKQYFSETAMAQQVVDIYREVLT